MGHQIAHAMSTVWQVTNFMVHHQNLCHERRSTLPHSKTLSQLRRYWPYSTISATFRGYRASEHYFFTILDTPQLSYGTYLWQELSEDKTTRGWKFSFPFSKKSETVFWAVSICPFLATHPLSPIFHYFDLITRAATSISFLNFSSAGMGYGMVLQHRHESIVACLRKVHLIPFSLLSQLTSPAIDESEWLRVGSLSSS